MKTILVVGAGPAGLMAADAAAAAGARVIVCDAMASPARKFLMAGRSGLNITHAEDFDTFATRYGDAAAHLRPMLEAFSPIALRGFCESLGQPTFIGSSGRVFPRAMKASPLLRAWLSRLAAQGVVLRLRHRLVGLTEAAARFAAPDGEQTIAADAIILALGGASWPRLGADGAWVDMLRANGIAVAPLEPANCGAMIDWPADFLARHEGAPLKTATFCAGEVCVSGEAVATRRGLEGGPIYALASVLRRMRAPMLTIDLKPGLAQDALAARLSGRSGDSTANRLRKAGVSPIGAGLLRLAGPPPRDAEALAERIKNLKLPIKGVAGLERAISSAGGVSFDELDETLMVKKRPGLFVAGEMIDFDAPTGGYLLQAAFATGHWAGLHAARGSND